MSDDHEHLTEFVVAVQRWSDGADGVLLLVFPILLGTGKRIFSEGPPPRKLALVSTKAVSSGVIQQHLQAQRAFADQILR